MPVPPVSTVGDRPKTLWPLGETACQQYLHLRRRYQPLNSCDILAELALWIEFRQILLCQRGGYAVFSIRFGFGKQ